MSVSSKPDEISPVPVSDANAPPSSFGFSAAGAVGAGAGAAGAGAGAGFEEPQPITRGRQSVRIPPRNTAGAVTRRRVSRDTGTSYTALDIALARSLACSRLPARTSHRAEPTRTGNYTG